MKATTTLLDDKTPPSVWKTCFSPWDFAGPERQIG